MSELQNNDPPDELQGNFIMSGNVGADENVLDNSDNNHFQIEGEHDDSFPRVTEDDTVNDTQVNEASVNVNIPPDQHDPMATSGDADQPERSEMYPGDESHDDLLERTADDNNVDDIERTLEILDRTNIDRNESVDEIEHTLEMLEAEEPTNFETNQIELDTVNTDIGESSLNETENETDQNANDDVQMSFEEEENANQSLNPMDDSVEENNPIQDTIEIDDDEDNEDDNQGEDSRNDEDVEEINDDQEDQEEHNEDHDENNEFDVQETEDNEENVVTIQETEDNEEQDQNQNQDDLEDNPDSGENVIHEENNLDNEPMEVQDDENELENASETISEEKKSDESPDHNDVEGKFCSSNI